MMKLWRFRAVVLAWLALASGAAPTLAQENLDAGKSPAQLFASDCALCHKSSRGLSKSGGLFGLTGFLREHYTASRETAAALAAYLQQLDAVRPAEKPRQVRRSKPSGKPKAGDKKTEEAKKPSDAKPSDAKPSDATPSETKPVETKPVEAKPVEAKPVEAKPVEAKQVETKPSESKDTQSASTKPATESKASADKPADAKSDKKE